MTELSATAARSNTGSLLDDVLDEVSARLARGEAVDIEEYAARHADCAERLRKVFPAMQAMALLGRNAAAAGTTSESSSAGEAALAGVLGDFRILRQVGRGGMGVVYEAQQISLGRRVALKVLPFASMLDPRSLARFRNEALAVAQLDHPHIVDVIGVGSDRGVHFYAMRFVDGRSLAEVIEALRQLAEQHPDAPPLETISDVPHLGATADHDHKAATGGRGDALHDSPAPPPAAETAPVSAAPTRRSRSHRRRPAYYRSIADLGMAVAEALDHAHEQGIIHRDIKPSNLMLDGRGKVWVTDFGLARIEADTAMTMTGDLLGTLRYMSPEQSLAKRIVVDHRTDVYSLGVTLYELLTLRVAFDGDSREEILRKIAFEEPIAPRRHDPGIPSELETILLKAIEKNPADRYLTAADLAADLRRYLDDKPVKAKRPGAVKRVGRWARKHRGVAVVALAMLFVLAVVSTTGAALLATAKHKTDEALKDVTENYNLAQQRQAELEAVQEFLVDRVLGSAAPEMTLGRDVRVAEVLASAEGAIDDAFKHQPLVEASVRLALAKTYLSLLDSKSAERHVVRVIAIRSSQLGKDHADTLEAESVYGRVLLNASRLADARRVSGNVLARRSRTCGPNHIDTLCAMSDVAITLRSQGEYAEAESLQRDALASIRLHHADDSERIINASKVLATILHDRGRWGEARALLEEVLAQRRREHGDDHPLTVAAAEGIAIGEYDQGHYAVAKELFAEILERTTRVYGAKHELTMRRLSNYANAIWAMGNSEEARLIYVQVHDSLTLTLGSEHERTLHAAEALAAWDAGMGDFAKAAERFRSLYESRSRMLGPEHPATLRTIAGLAESMSHVGTAPKHSPLVNEPIPRRNSAWATNMLRRSESRMCWPEY